jgi:negative regulator of genetic competence, sporulation and motility
MRTTVYPRVARELGLKSWNKEYYTLDGMLYEERGVDDTGKYATYANWISVAIEHENDSARAHEKMNKLQSFNAPLKVLITYAPPGDASEALLRRYENLIRSSDVFNDVATLRQQLVILGTPKTVLEWRCYAYENDGFVLMLPN